MEAENTQNKTERKLISFIKGLTTWFRPYNKERDGDAMLKNKKGKKFIQEGRVETKISTTVKRILLYPHGVEKNYLSIYLSCGDSSFLPTGCWSKIAKYKLTLKNYYYCGKDKTLEGEYEFSSGKHRSSGYSSFITLTEFHDRNKGFLVNDTYTIVAEVCVENDGHRHPNDNHIMSLVTGNNNDELMDFKGLCRVRKDFVQLLEEACSKHPELVRGVKRKNWSENFTERWFMTLGRVLHFLKSHKDIKDMDDDTYEELQDLWEQLNSFGFDDLIWLEDDVKKYMAKKMRKNVDLEGEKGEFLKVELRLCHLVNSGQYVTVIKGFDFNLLKLGCTYCKVI
ncbi:hypothetical protein S83_040209 [Arachis hypogaea]